MGIIYGSTVLTKADRNSVIKSTISTLTGEYESLSSDRSLMDEALSLERIYNTVESSEIHPGFSFFANEITPEIGECDTTREREEFYESLARLCNTRI
jgi:hypothetical protein